MHENQIATIVIDICYQIHHQLGPGLLESVYEGVLSYELQSRGISFTRQKPVPVIWKEFNMEFGFRLDLLVEEKVIVELKSVESLNPVYHKILLTYLRLTDKRLGLLINFHELLFKHGVKRIVNGLK